MAQVNFTVYNLSENSCDMKLTEDGANLSQAQYDAITRVQVWIDSAVVADSDVNAAWFDWGGGVKQQIDVKLGFAGIAAGGHMGYVKVFDAGNPAGVRWDTTINFTVVDP